jgi:hypothetical protein
VRQLHAGAQRHLHEVRHVRQYDGVFVIAVTSTAISQIEYDELSQELIVTFTSGRTYTYDSVPPAVYSQFLGAESKGQFFNEYIKGRYRYSEH